MSKEKELRDGVVGTAEKLIQSSVEELRTIQSRVDDPVSSEVSSTMPKRVNLQEAGLRRSVRQVKFRAQKNDKEPRQTRLMKR